MNPYDFLEAMDNMDDTVKMEVLDTMYTKSNNSRKGLLRTLLIAAVIAALSCTTVFAGGAIYSREQAWTVAQEEIAAMQQAGILADGITMSAEPERLQEIEEQTGDDYWFGRIRHHSYNVGSHTHSHYINMDVDTATGKITRLHIEAYADENDIPVGTMEFSGKTENLYDNFEDLFPANMTIDDFCSHLAAYWGFTGYTLAGTRDEVYQMDTDTPDGSMLLRDMPEDNFYLTVYFDGDQEGVPMYIQKSKFPGRVALLVGTHHMVG